MTNYKHYAHGTAEVPSQAAPFFSKRVLSMSIFEYYLIFRGNTLHLTLSFSLVSLKIFSLLKKALTFFSQSLYNDLGN